MRSGFIHIVAVVMVATVCDAQDVDNSWRQYASPAEAGFDADMLEEVGTLADSVGSGALMVIYEGNVLASWGDVERKFELHSVRKSLVSALFGQAIHAGIIDLDDTLEDLNIGELTPLSEKEKSARVRHLLSATSGVYLPAAYSPEDQDRNRPQRGSHDPGSHWFYNNWDFNVAGVIYEQETGSDLYDAFEEYIAGPIGMEDYSSSDRFLAWEPSVSVHPAQTFRMSTRDLARFGKLYLQEGLWDGEQVIPSGWVRESTSMISDFENGRGYGYMWWTYEPGNFGASYPFLDKYHAYMGRGTGSQAVFVVPDLNLVIVHRGDTYRTRGVRGRYPLAMIDKIIAAKTGDAAARPKLIAHSSTPLSSQQPVFDWPDFVTLRGRQKRKLVGDYQIENGPVVSIFLHDNELFGVFPGRGEAQLFATSETSFIIRVEMGVSMSFPEGAQGTPQELHVQLGPQKMVAVKIDS